MSKTPQDAWLSVRAFLNFAEVARAIGITRASISAWPYVPEERVEAVSEATKIPCHELRPDVYPPPDTRPWKT